MAVIDLNCDMGESYGAWRMGNDAELMNYVSSVNIACGFHAGDATTMRQTAELATDKGVSIGAHPGYPDLQGFGRRAMKMSVSEVFDTVLYQVAAMKGICEALGTRLNHVKPHGALYNQAAKEPELAAAVAEAVRKIDSDIVFYGLSGSSLISEAERLGLRTASEVFADRTYQANGSLTPRSQPNALIQSEDESVKQVLQMVSSGTVFAIDGKTIPLRADTICIHGDGEHAVEFARGIRDALLNSGNEIRSISGK
jgi:UPF0271 protein